MLILLGYAIIGIDATYYQWPVTDAFWAGVIYTALCRMLLTPAQKTKG